MRVVTLTDKPTGHNPNVLELPRFAGNVMGVTSVNQIDRPFEALLLVDAAGDYFAVPISSGMSDLRRYVESIACLDLAPHVEIAYVGMESLGEAHGSSFFASSRLEGMKVKLIAWRFDEGRDRARSALKPKSPRPFPVEGSSPTVG
jgi:hypothetical protein